MNPGDSEIKAADKLSKEAKCFKRSKVYKTKQKRGRDRREGECILFHQCVMLYTAQEARSLP